MSFMQQQIADKQTWLKIDGSNGTTYLPIDALYQNRSAFLLLSEEQQLATCQVYYEGEAESVELVSGYGARLSAPGYLDCTEWSVFNTAAEAQAYLDEYYPEDDEEE